MRRISGARSLFCRYLMYARLAYMAAMTLNFLLYSLNMSPNISSAPLLQQDSG